jgi:hypothetical protein
MRTRLGPATIALLLIVVSIAPLYVLSIFPVMQLAYDDKLSWETIDTIYAPVLWVNERCPIVNDWLVAGENWWRGGTPNPPEYVP